MTSGNRSEEPIVRENLQAHRQLEELADAFLLHDRQIHVGMRRFGRSACWKTGSSHSAALEATLRCHDLTLPDAGPV